MTTKTTRIIDLNLFSGSSELLRQAAGGYYGDLAGTGDVSFRGAEITDIGGVESIEESEVDATSDTILPKVKYASRLYVDEGQGFLSDEDWKTFIIGGTYADKTYSGLYNEAVYADHANTSSLPYVPRETVNNSNIEPSLVLTTEYFNYYPSFQSEVNNLESELQAPNYYLLDSASYLVPSYNNEIVQSRYQYSNLTAFLTDGYVNSPKPLDTRMENIFVLERTSLVRSNRVRLDTSDLNSDFVDGDLSKLYSLMPFGNKLEIKQDLAASNGDFRQIINQNNYRLKFVKLLKEIFQGESALPPATVNFAVNTESEISTGTLINSVESTTTIPVRLVDAPTMLLYAYQNPMSETNNIAVINSGSYQQQIDYALDASGSYRYQNTQKSLDVLNDFMAVIKDKFGNGTTKTYPLQEFLNQADEPKYHETVAFRIEKIGGAPTGDARTENTIQNIWFYNTNEAITYFDTQVKYNSDYTYKVYKYDLVQGYKYQLSDVVATRQIATEGEGTSKVYCLEFYDPFSGQTRQNLLDGFDELSILQTRMDLLTQEMGVLQDKIDEIAPLHETNREFANSVFGFSREETIQVPDGRGGTEPRTVERDYRISDDYYFGLYLSTFYGDPNFIGIPYFIEEITLDDNIFSTFALIPFERIIGQVERGEISEDVLFIRNYEEFVVFREEFENIQDTINQQKQQYESEKAELSRDRMMLDMARLRLNRADNELFTNSQTNSTYPHFADFRITIEPSLKIVEIPLEEKRMRIVDHPPNDFVITPHHLLDQSNRLAFYCKYDTFSMNAVTYPPALNARDTQNKDAYLTGHDFLQISKLTQESVSRPRFLEVYRTTTKPTSYDDFSGNLRTTIDLKQENGDIPTDHLFIERVRDNAIYYYVFRSLNENGIAGQFSPVFESELINDGGYVYGRFQQHSEEDLAVIDTKDPLSVVKKLFNVVPNIQHLVLDSSNVDLNNSSVSEIDNISLGSSNLTDPLITSDSGRYFKIRLTSKKTGRKLDINIGFKKEVRK